MQREQIERWAYANGILLGTLFEELDESGARKDRPLFLRAIERVEAGHSRGVIVAKLDRFGRSLTDGLAAIERIHRANGTFVSVQDGLDLRTDTGRLVMRIMLSMAEWELDRVRSNWDQAKAKAIARGVHLGRTPPFGYYRGSQGRLRIDVDTGGVAKELFRRRSEGATLRELCHWLEKQGVLTTRGNAGWSDATVRHIVRNRVYLGELKSGPHIARAAHPPLVDRGTWQRAQAPRVSNALNPQTPTLLGGLLRCSGCRRVLHSQTKITSSGRRISSYACHARFSQGRCRAPAYVTGPLIEPYVEQVFFGELCSLERRSTASKRRLGQRQKQVDEAEAALEQYRDSARIPDVIGERRYLAGLEARTHTVAVAMQSLAAEERRADDIGMPAARELEDRWPSMTVDERRAAIGEAIDCVFMNRGWGNVVGRAFVCFRGGEPSELPAPGAAFAVTAPFHPRDARFRRATRAPRLWTRARIRERLASFLGERSSWPSPEQFTVSGYGPLYAQVVLTGGPEYWAQQMSVGRPRTKQGICAWDEALAEKTLRRFVRGRRSFPTRREFADDGFRGLWNWLQKHGGLSHWARRVGPFPESNRRSGF